MEAIVEVTQLSKSFGDIVAVHDLFFSLMEIDVYGFPGQNGAALEKKYSWLYIFISQHLSLKN